MASISITKDGKTKVTYEVNSNDGTRKRKSKTFKNKTSKKEVEAFIRQVENDYYNGDLYVSNLNLAEFYEEFMLLKKPTYTLNTIKTYTKAWNNDNGLKKRFGNYKLKDIKYDSIQLYINDLDSIGLSSKTIKNYIGFLGTLLSEALKKQYITGVLQTSLATFPKSKRRKMQSYTTEELSTLLKISKDKPQTNAIIAIGGLSGLRCGEITALEWDDIDLYSNEPCINVSKSAVGDKGIVVVKPPKTDAGYRTIYISNTLKDILLEYKEHKDSSNHKKSKYVFSKPDGTIYNPFTISKNYRQFIKSQRTVKHLKLHELRHTFASISLSLNADIKTVQESLGHSNMATTADTYCHGFKESKINLAHNLDIALSTSI